MIFKNISGVLLLCLFCQWGVSQTYEPPKPRMNKNIQKDFIQTHIEYPPQSLKNGEEGKVVLSFTVDKDGKITKVNVVESVSQAVDSAAIQLFSKILWTPAKSYSKPVDGEGEFKIKYDIKKYGGLVKKRGYDKIIYPYLPYDSSSDILTVKQLDQAPEAILDSIFRNVQEFIVNNLEFPESAQKLSIEGSVKLRFVIEPSGLPSNIMIIQPVGGGCTEEAIRITQELKWFPGIKSGKAVRTCYNLTIKFDAADELKNKHIPSQTNSGI